MADRQQSGRKKPPKFKAGNRQRHQGDAAEPLPSTSTPDVQDNDIASQSLQRQQEDFDRELLWCIEQLEKGLRNASSASDQKKAQDAAKVLRILQNPKTPLIKKRQAMRNTFGDYRKKMEAQLKQASSVYKKMAVNSVTQSGQSKSSFFKKAKLSHENRSSHTAPVSSVELDLQNLDIGSNPNSDFKFNFAQSQPEGNGPTQTDCKNRKAIGEPEVPLKEEKHITSANQPPSMNFFSMKPSNKEEFKFNFSPSSDT